MADFFVLHRQTHVLFHRSSSRPLAVVEAGSPAAPAQANMNNVIDPSKGPQSRRCGAAATVAALSASAAAGTPALARAAGARRRRAAGSDGVPRTHGAGYPLPDCKNRGSTHNVLTVI
jgi:hypothetical protein